MPGSLVALDAPRAVREFDQRPFSFPHFLVDHPLLQLPRLIELSTRLPPPCVEYNAGDLDIDMAGRETPSTGLSAAETLRRIEVHNSWMVLQNIEHDAQYSALVDDVLDDIERACCGHRPTRQREGYVFISSPRAVTPYHMDPEHGFLLQICGTKRVTVFDGRQSAVVSADDLERFYGGMRTRHMELRTDADLRAWTFELGPGDGVHIPVTFPHYVQVGGEVSVSLSVTFRTPDLARREAVHQVNGFLRRRGLNPRPFGQSPAADLTKTFAAVALRSAQRLSSRIRLTSS